MNFKLNKEVVSKMTDDELHDNIDKLNERLRMSIDANYGKDVGMPPLSVKEHFELWDLLLQLVIYVEMRKKDGNENAEP